MGSQEDGSTHSPLSDWAAVWAMVAGATAMGVAIIMAWTWLGIVGGVVLVAAAVFAVVTGLMDHTEDYPAHEQPDALDRSAAVR